ncbi:uncharacterized protein N7483_005705 [Penicillium malachiteum]|uniref:uncharacterized protein n=1 Tax=Penicillium malachiteum TaxID=1324776 RepID=UPI002548A8A5|nr:uncharacterized protein N7483_005705 [Penicillium malachiteum]KAJ5731197.1 hypothetical protein N7483_005705 [Penicillium malachiteum]
MSTAPNTAMPAANSTAIPSHPKIEQKFSSTQGTAQSSSGPATPVNWDSEIQLVASLAKLQELESKIHELRQFIPAGVLEPLVPISSSNGISSSTPVAETPPILRNDLDHAVRDRLARIEQFQSMWRGPELKPVWARATARMKEANGQLIQPTGIWERDYDVLLAELTSAEKKKEDERLREEEDAERTKVLSSEGGWTAVTERFTQRGFPGVRFIKGSNDTSMGIALGRAGMLFVVEGVKDSGSTDVSEWNVSSKVPPGRSPVKLEEAILDCLNSRPRKWDLSFLLDMIASYANIKQTPCIKCNRLANNAARLPSIRRAQSTQPTKPEDSKDRVFSFDAFHTACA